MWYTVVNTLSQASKNTDLSGLCMAQRSYHTQLIQRPAKRAKLSVPLMTAYLHYDAPWSGAAWCSAYHIVKLKFVDDATRQAAATRGTCKASTNHGSTQFVLMGASFSQTDHSQPVMLILLHVGVTICETRDLGSACDGRKNAVDKQSELYRSSLEHPKLKSHRNCFTGCLNILHQIGSHCCSIVRQPCS